MRCQSPSSSEKDHDASRDRALSVFSDDLCSDGRRFSIERIEEELNALAKRMIEPELLKEVLVRMGPAFEEITNVARDCEADLIVITTHGCTGIRHVVMGSTAERAVRHAPCPVPVVRKREHEFV